MRLASASVILITLIGLSACTAIDAPTETTSGTPIVTSVPEASPTSTSQSAVVAFGGDCGTILSLEQASELLHASSVDVASQSRAYPPDLTMGALTCSWSSDGEELRVSALPASTVPPRLIEERATPACDSPTWFCGASATIGDLWVVVERPGGMEPEPDWEADVTSAMAAVSASAEKHPSARPAERADDWWTIPSCESLDTAIDVNAIMGSDAVEPNFPGDNTPMGDVWDSLVYSQLDSWCPWTDYGSASGSTLEVQIWPGAAAAADARLSEEGAEPVTVAGADRAVMIQGDHDRTDVYAVVGPNVLWVYDGNSTDDAKLIRFAEAILAQL